MKVKKYSGEQESFNPDKLCNSLLSAGVSHKKAEEVCAIVQTKLKPGDSTTKVFRAALRALVKDDIEASARYGLHRAVDSLGPAGFLFEQYIEALLQAYGYNTKQGTMMKGECATHEIDVYAEKGGFKYLVEAKYRNRHSIKTHIDQVMYADARLMDIQRRAVKQNRNPNEYTMWVITNTRFTSNAIKYAKCRGVKLVSWNYPRREGNLEQMIVRKKMYPITVLPSLSETARNSFAEHNMILAQDLIPYSVNDLVKIIGISKIAAGKLLREAHAIIKK